MYKENDYQKSNIKSKNCYQNAHTFLFYQPSQILITLGIFATNYNFLITIQSQPNVADLIYFNSVRSNNIIKKYQMLLQSGSFPISSSSFLVSSSVFFFLSSCQIFPSHNPKYKSFCLESLFQIKYVLEKILKTLVLNNL